ncbi:hypothetical protein, partial [Klebsiella pneumoniae]|uniref:hypothetical protein n=1 Tax=Klebsiella pneumoniae TaxID=573 RepID=UPI0025A06531
MIGSRRALLRSTRRRLLHDHFGKPAAAGSVNATPATPGPGGLRTVTDTTNLMQVAPWKAGTRLADETTMSAT